MAATSPTCSVEIGIGKSIGRGIGEGIDVGNQVTEGYEVGSAHRGHIHYPWQLLLSLSTLAWHYGSRLSDTLLAPFIVPSPPLCLCLEPSTLLSILPCSVAQCDFVAKLCLVHS